jgi:hypothetical protein
MQVEYTPQSIIDAYSCLSGPTSQQTHENANKHIVDFIVYIYSEFSRAICHMH